MRRLFSRCGIGSGRRDRRRQGFLPPDRGDNRAGAVPQFGTMLDESAKRNMRMLAAEVKLHLR